MPLLHLDVLLPVLLLLLLLRPPAHAHARVRHAHARMAHRQDRVGVEVAVLALLLHLVLLKEVWRVWVWRVGPPCGAVVGGGGGVGLRDGGVDAGAACRAWATGGDEVEL